MSAITAIRSGSPRPRAGTAQALLLLVGLAASLPAMAESEDSEWVLGIGSTHAATGSNGRLHEESRWETWLLLEYSRGRYFASTRRGVGLQLALSPQVGAFVALGYGQGRPKDGGGSSSRLAGLERISGSMLVLSGLQARAGKSLSLSATLAVPWRREQGASVNLGASLQLAATADWEVALEANTTYSTARRASTFFGTTPEQSASTGLPVFRASAGWSSQEALLSVSYRFDRHWTAQATAGEERRLGAAADSPLFGRRSNVVGSITVGYRF